MGCLSIPGENCHLPSQTGSCTDYVDKWFFDMNYGWQYLLWDIIQLCISNSFQGVVADSGMADVNREKIILKLRRIVSKNVLSQEGQQFAFYRKWKVLARVIMMSGIMTHR